MTIFTKGTPWRKYMRWAGITLSCLILFRFCVYPFTPLPRLLEYHLSNRLDAIEGGEVEIVIPAETGIRGSSLSPDGRWAAWGSHEDEQRSGLFLRNLTTGEDIDISNVEWRGDGWRWLSGDSFVARNNNRYWIVQLPELEAQELNVIQEEWPQEQLTELFAPYNDIIAYEGFNGSGSATALIAFDANPPLVYSYGLDPEPAKQLAHVVYERPGLDDAERQYSPDGRFYAGTTNRMLADLYIYDAKTNSQIAVVKRDGRTVEILGWSPDSRSVYFQFEVGGASGGILHPYEPLFKFTLDTAQDSSTNETTSTWLSSAVGNATLIQANTPSDNWYVESTTCDNGKEAWSGGTPSTALQKWKTCPELGGR